MSGLKHSSIQRNIISEGLPLLLHLHLDLCDLGGTIIQSDARCFVVYKENHYQRYI